MVKPQEHLPNLKVYMVSFFCCFALVFSRFLLVKKILLNKKSCFTKHHCFPCAFLFFSVFYLVVSSFVICLNKFLRVSFFLFFVLFKWLPFYLVWIYKKNSGNFGGPFGAIMADRGPSRPRHPHLEAFADLRSPHESSGARPRTEFQQFSIKKCERFSIRCFQILHLSDFKLRVWMSYQVIKL